MKNSRVFIRRDIEKKDLHPVFYFFLSISMMKNTPVVLGKHKQGKNKDQLIGFTPYNSPYRFLSCCYIPKEG